MDSEYAFFGVQYLAYSAEMVMTGLLYAKILLQEENKTHTRIPYCTQRRLSNIQRWTGCNFHLSQGGGICEAVSRSLYYSYYTPVPPLYIGIPCFIGVIRSRYLK